jgi:transcription elongation factor Elf1
MRTWCPRCNQGWVVSARLKKTKELLMVCQECEATWRDGIEPGSGPFDELATFLGTKGLPWDWKELEIPE